MTVHAGPTHAEVGESLRIHAEETLRLWRSTRRHARPATFPGLLDDLIVPFVRAVGATLAAGGDPRAVWDALAGVARFPREGAAAEHEQEWQLAGEVAAAVADALHAGPDARLHAIAAARACSEATRWMSERPGPSQGPVLKVVVFAGGRTRGR